MCSSAAAVAAAAIGAGPLADFAHAQKPAPRSRKRRLSPKKGIGHGVGNAHDWDDLKELRVSWLYNWTPDVFEGRPADIEFVPMIWKADGDHTRDAIGGLKGKGYKNLLGFNEPDGRDQANMTVEKAIEAWPMLMDAGLRLGSPGAVHPDNDWMKKFMQQAADHRYRIDFVAVHWYGDPNPQQLIKVLDDAYRLYRRPLWITEFAVADWQNGAGKPPRFTADQVVQFMQAVLPLLERSKVVERYAWFPAGVDDQHLGMSALREGRCA